MYINIVHFFSKTLGGGKNNHVMSSISDQCNLYAKYNKNASTRACFLKFLRENNPLQECIARCVPAIIDIFYNK